ncbi:helix-hairpin-helix domain-containing protein [Sporosarcina thermotolerans]|uniref:Helix-hairpin-helix domain-containing protein n=1 Tax=Sporosarcina thermotolerans TaxID=633404 RepID=A0AAW9A8U1_9BACL|nr:helix-hairpin-helix domain-containing protein [Sporosarcina thermotolerans]MDW0117410.1 helix-hairpin-helix domain-containing protein [Sporosarcina thermotolerans]WHT47547.1 helix-hairpin-helix domain-containing protein [Sporosarcina thermotolerans]
MLLTSFSSGKWRRIITPIAAIAVLSAILFFPRGQADNHPIIVSGQSPIINVLEEELPEEEPTDSKDEIFPVLIMVDIQGAVKYPGVYSLVEGDRLIDAIHAAGGYLPNADSRMLNHAMKLVDELFIYIPREGEEMDFYDSKNVSMPHSGIGQQNNDGKVNINLADVQELMTIPGIGPSKAAAIVKYREENGFFNSPEAIMVVSGIGQKTFEKLESFISTN